MANSEDTLAHLRTIAEANGTDIDAFLRPERRAEYASETRSGGRYRWAAMLPRFFRAYLALPGAESRLQALRMMEAMAARAKGLKPHPERWPPAFGKR